jgi:hypothetical protein
MVGNTFNIETIRQAAADPDRVDWLADTLEKLFCQHDPHGRCVGICNQARHYQKISIQMVLRILEGDSLEHALVGALTLPKTNTQPAPEIIDKLQTAIRTTSWAAS